MRLDEGQGPEFGMIADEMPAAVPRLTSLRMSVLRQKRPFHNRSLCDTVRNRRSILRICSVVSRLCGRLWPKAHAPTIWGKFRLPQQQCYGQRQYMSIYLPNAPGHSVRRLRTDNEDANGQSAKSDSIISPAYDR